MSIAELIVSSIVLIFGLCALVLVFFISAKYQSKRVKRYEDLLNGIVIKLDNVDSSLMILNDTIRSKGPFVQYKER